MDNEKTDEYYLAKIISDLTFIVRHTQDISRDSFEKDEVLQDSVKFRLIQISENSNRLTESFKEEHKDIPWRAIKGLRNRIVHEYGSVDLTIIYDTVSEDIPILLDTLFSS